MPIIDLTIRAFGQQKIIEVDTDLRLIDYKDMISMIISKMASESKSEVQEHELYNEEDLVSYQSRISDLEDLEQTTLDAKPVTNHELGILFLSLVPEKYQRSLVVSDSNTEDEKTIANRLNALGLIIDNTDVKLDTTFLKRVHQTCKGDAYPEIKGGKFYNTETAGAPFGFQFTDLSVNAFEDAILFAKKYSHFGITANIESDILDMKGHSLSSIDNFKLFHTKLIVAYSKARVEYRDAYKDNTPMFFYSIDHTKEACETVIQKIFDNYYSAINKAKLLKDDNLIIQAIVECQYDILMLQGFEDLNTRTSLVILNILLMQNNFPPTSLFQPGISKQELSSIVKTGMLRTIEMMEDNLNGQYHEIISKTKERILQLKDYPHSKWIIHRNPETNHIKVGKGLTRLTLDDRFFSAEEKMRYASSFKKDKKPSPSQSQIRLSPHSFDSGSSLSSTQSISRSVSSNLTPTGSPFSGSRSISMSPDIFRAYSAASMTPSVSPSIGSRSLSITPDSVGETLDSPRTPRIQSAISRSVSAEAITRKPSMFRKSNLSKQTNRSTELNDDSPKKSCRLM